MRYLKRYKSHDDIRSICLRYGIENYTINNDGSIDADVVNLTYKGLTKLPLKFGKVTNCWLNHNFLISLEGCPESVGKNFYCDNNNLTSLENCPKSVGGDFYCNYNKLTNLEGCPKSIGDGFVCGYNEIETFEGLDFVNICDDFYCRGNPIYEVWRLFMDHTKFEFFNDCDPIREDRIIILDRLNFFLDYIDKPMVTEVEGYKCI